MIIALILEGHHTEHLELFLEILKELGHKVLIYNNRDAYGNIELVKKQFEFDKHGLLRIGHIDCDRYIVLSHTIAHFNLFKKFKHEKIIYLAHIPSEFIEISKDIDAKKFTMSKSICGPDNSVLSISRRNYNRISLDKSELSEYEKIKVVKFGWLSDNEQGYRKLLDTGKVSLYIFNQGPTLILNNLLDSYPSDTITVFVKHKSDFIYDFITKNNVRFVYYNPSTVDLFSGSITFAINNSMILLTNDKVIDYYNFPSEYMLSMDCEPEKMIEKMRKKRVDGNPGALQCFRDVTFSRNVKILVDVLN